MMRWLKDPGFRARVALVVIGLCVIGVIICLIAGRTAQAASFAVVALVGVPGVVLNRMAARRKP